MTIFLLFILVPPIFLHAQSILYEHVGDFIRDNFAWPVSGIGDVDNDGYADFIVGAPRDSSAGSNAGSARVLSGIDGTVIHTLTGDETNSVFGFIVSRAGDVDNDGSDDVVIAAPYDNDNGIDSGTVWVFSGSDGTIIYTFKGVWSWDWFGYSASGAGDVNNDGFADVIVGAPRNDMSATDAGMARVYSGFDGSILYTFTGKEAEDWFGYSVSEAGDINHDGFEDIVIGAKRGGPAGENAGTVQVFSFKGLQLDGPFPGVADSTNTWTIGEATPGETVHLFYSSQPGFTDIPECPGLALEIRSPVMAGTAIADSSGTATFDAFVSEHASGKTLFFQAVERMTCTVSNHVKHTFP